MTNFAKKRILDIFSISSLHSINKKEKREYLDCLIGNDIVSTRIKSVIHDEKGKMVSEGAARTIFSHLDKGYRTWSVWELENI